MRCEWLVAHLIDVHGLFGFHRSDGRIERQTGKTGGLLFDFSGAGSNSTSTHEVG